MRSPRKAVSELGAADESGASAVEYSLLAAFIAAGLVTVVAALGTTLPGGFTAVNEGLTENGVTQPEEGPGGAGRGNNNGGARGHGSGSGGDGGNSGQGHGPGR